MSARFERSRAAVPQEAPFPLIIVLFVLSGATGLVDQLCFAKYLSYVVGSTAHAVSAVLAAFMTGLALGAFLGGGFARRVSRPLLAYGVLELVVALAVAVSPHAFQALAPLYASVARSAPESVPLLSVLRWLSALLIVIVPTTAMGATLPLLSRLLPAGATAATAPRLRERRLGALYASNTAGGAIGALLAAYAILPVLGMDGTLRASACGSALIGLLAIYFGRAASAAPWSEAAAVPETVPLQARSNVASYFMAFASGALVFSAEVVFTHLLALIIGNSAYAFGLILAVFLACLFVGASRAAELRVRYGEAALPFGLVVTGLTLVMTLPLWDRLPLVFDGTGKHIESFVARELVRGLIAFAALAIPTVFMGLTFPLLLQRAANSQHVALLIGRLTTVNTLGAVAGSLTTGYLLLPALGSQHTLVAIALAFVAAGLVSTPLIARRASRVVCYGLAGGTGLLWWALPGWQVARLTAGSNVYFEDWRAPDEVLFVRDDVHGGVTTVTRHQGIYSLYTNGKFQGNTGWEMDAQRLFAHYPSIFVERFERALVVGLGTGTTLGTLSAYPWRQLDVVEISPAIVEAADRFFSHVNRRSLHDPRVRLHIGDGRNFLLVESRQYDLISMELSSIWFAGASSLYSREFYDLAKRHLAPGGILQQWVQLHHVRREDFATIVNTLRQAFPHVALFYGGGQGILIASRSPLAASETRVAQLQQRSEVLETMPEKRPLMDLLRDVLVANADLDRFLEDSARETGKPLRDMISTDGNLYLEYATPRGNVLPWSAREELVAKISSFQTAVSTTRLHAP
jgi:spermidine synthase